MTTRYLRGVLIRDLRGLRREVEAYERESDLWKVPEGISNSAGNLVLHLAGNLQCFVGAVLGSTGYERDRKGEFARRNVPRGELLEQIDRAIEAVESTLAKLGSHDLEAVFPWELAGVRVTTGDFLLHLSTHLAYHLGQVDYHRRWVTGHNVAIGAMGIPELASAHPAGADA